MPRSSSSTARRHGSSSALGRELRAASRRELSTLKRELQDKHRERMKRSRTKEASERRKKLVIGAAEVGGTAAAAGAARAFLGDRMDIGPVPLELPMAIAGHLAGGYFYPDDERGEHVHNIANGLMAVAAFQGGQRMTRWARERAQRSSSETTPAPTVSHGDYGSHAYAGALPPPPALSLPPPPLPPPSAYAPMPTVAHPTVAGVLPPVSAADRAMAEAIRVMEDARHG